MDDDLLIIHNLPLFLADSARAWLQHLPPRWIRDWADLVRAFVGNFQGTYVRLGNTWDLRSCRQNPDETLHEFIRRFSKQCTELPNVTDSDVIGAFIVGTTCRELVHELGRRSPTKASELLDIATNFATGEEAVGAIFPDTKGKRKEDTVEDSTSRDPKKKKKGKPGKRQHQKDALVAATDRKNPQGPLLGPREFSTKCSRSHAPITGARQNTLWRSAP
jgi:hypothetical protein